jgi:hypothetical protein
MKGIIFAVFCFFVFSAKAENLNAILDFGIEKSKSQNVQEFKNSLEVAKKVVRFCELYAQEFSVLVKSCSKYSDRAVAAMKSVTSETCESLKTGIAQLEAFTKGSECQPNNPNVFFALEENLSSFNQLASTVAKKIADYQTSLSNEERVPLTGAISREILIVWAMEVTPKYARCPIQTQGESNQALFGQSNDATKIYFRWKQGLMCSSQLENAVLARETTAKTKVERERITELKKMMQGEGLALELTDSGLQVTNNKMTWNEWLHARTPELMNKDRDSLSLEAQRSWSEQSGRSCLSNVAATLQNKLSSLIEQAQARDSMVLEICSY